jgi:hypothetical protein
MNSFVRKPAGPRSLSRALSAALGLAAAAVLCAADSGPGYRIGILKGNTLSVKENALNAPWVAEAEDVSSFLLEGDRIGVRRRDGTVLVKAGGLSAPWVQVARQSQSFGLSGDRIAVLSAAGSLDVKEGALNARWVRVADGARDFQMQGRRIAILISGGALQLLDGAPGGALVHEADNVQSYQLSGQRLGVLYRAGGLDVKEGAADAPWVHEADGVRSFFLEGNRIGVLRNTSLDVKEGRLDAPWVREAEQVDSFILNGESMAMLQGGVLTVKSGRLDAAWTWQSAEVQKFQLHGPRIAIQKRDGTFSVKEEGLQSASWVWLSGGVRLFQLAITGGTGGDSGTLSPPAPTGLPADWQRGAARGEVTKTLQLESPRRGPDSGANQVEVLFPAGYTYCRHALSDMTRTGPGGVTIIVAEPGRLVFGFWSGRQPDGMSWGRVRATATVTGTRTTHQRGIDENDGNRNDDDRNASACADLPDTGGGCGDQSCARFLDAGESDNGLCLPATCGDARPGRMEQPVCVYNLRADGRTQARARRLVCRNDANDFNPGRS